MCVPRCFHHLNLLFVFTRCQNLNFQFLKNLPLQKKKKRILSFCLICCMLRNSFWFLWVIFLTQLKFGKAEQTSAGNIFFVLQLSIFLKLWRLPLGLINVQWSHREVCGMKERPFTHYKHTNTERDALANLLLAKELQQYSGEFFRNSLFLWEKKKSEAKVSLNKLNENFSIFYLVLKLHILKIEIFLQSHFNKTASLSYFFWKKTFFFP